MTTDPHRHVCTVCGEGWRERSTILATPLAGELKGTRVQVPADGNLILAGFGPKLRGQVCADWVAQHEKRLFEEVVYGYCLDDGVVEVHAPNLTWLEDLLGSAFVRVEQGILVAKSALLVPKLRERTIGVAAGWAGDRRIIFWVQCSRRGAKRVEECLPLYHHQPPHAPQPPAPTA